MYDYPDTIIFKLRYVFVGLLIITSSFLLIFLISFILTNSAQAQSTNSYSSSSTSSLDDPNIIATGMFSAFDGISKSVDSTAAAVNNGSQSVVSASAKGGKLAINFAIGGTVATAKGLGKGVSAVLSVPGNLLGFASKSSVAGAIIRPSDHEEEVPIIDPSSPELLAAIASLPASNPSKQASSQTNLGPQWPIHGYVTEEFGVPHMPYQVVHTGIDISDGQVRGVTPVRPYRPGRVIEAVHSSYGFGNHVIIDHGNGVTSLYGHLDSISVQVGQDVSIGTTLGYEGTTGLSTGVHVHFEIRVNGQAANPHQFVGGQP